MRNTIKCLLIALMLVSAVGCGKKGGGSGNKAANPYNPFDPGGVPPITDPANPIDPDANAATADLTVTSKGAFDSYLGYTSNNPSDFKVVVSVQNMGSRGSDIIFGGTVKVNFKDNGVSYSDTFSSFVNPAGTVDDNDDNNKYNLLSSTYPDSNGALQYHGFFEDVRGRSNLSFPVFGGAIILVIDSTNDLGDGNGPTSANGSVWFYNYIGYAPVSPTNCWFVSQGPYDCRTWRSGDDVSTKRALEPDSRYTKLGTFEDLDISKGFN